MMNVQVKSFDNGECKSSGNGELILKFGWFSNQYNHDPCECNGCFQNNTTMIRIKHMETPNLTSKTKTIQQ